MGSETTDVVQPGSAKRAVVYRFIVSPFYRTATLRRAQADHEIIMRLTE